MKTIIVIVSIVSACMNYHRTCNCSKIATGCMFICVFTDLALRFPLGVCINMTKVAIGYIGLYFSGQKNVFANVCIYFNCVGIASGRISLPYCYSI